jgi:hypothetical protein
MEERPVTTYVTAPDGVSLAYQVIDSPAGHHYSRISRNFVEASAGGDQREPTSTSRAINRDPWTLFMAEGSAEHAPIGLIWWTRYPSPATSLRRSAHSRVGGALGVPDCPPRDIAQKTRAKSRRHPLAWLMGVYGWLDRGCWGQSGRPRAWCRALRHCRD